MKDILQDRRPRHPGLREQSEDLEVIHSKGGQDKVDVVLGQEVHEADTANHEDEKHSDQDPWVVWAYHAFAGPAVVSLVAGVAPPLWANAAIPCGAEIVTSACPLWVARYDALSTPVNLEQLRTFL